MPMLRNTLPIAFVACALTAGAARADPCEWVGDAVATRAVQALEHQPKVIAFCEPCGDKAPGEPEVAAHVDKQRVPGEPSSMQISIDHRGIDLAYVYVQTSEHRYTNLAALAGCPTTGVSPSLSIDDATESGVLIHADATPVAVMPAPIASEPTPAVVSVPSIYVISTPAAPAWRNSFFALAGGVGASGMLLVSAALARRRRRLRALVPRAAALMPPRPER